MNIRATIEEEHSKKQVLKIANYVGNNKERFDELMQVYLSGDNLITQRGAWAITHCVDANPSLAIPYLCKMVEMLQPDAHDVIKRNTLRVLTLVVIPESLLGKLTNLCFSYLQSESEAVAVRIFSMTVLLKIVQKEPDLKRELQLVIESIIPHGSAGIRSRGRRTLASLQNL